MERSLPLKCIHCFEISDVKRSLSCNVCDSMNCNVGKVAIVLQVLYRTDVCQHKCNLLYNSFGAVK
jgi:hypothetical protein